ncbi:MAG: OmpA family protein [Deltaproteobacteria bacterium]|nr:OmpA family protein [Deltaproteobacteria bacterium]
MSKIDFLALLIASVAPLWICDCTPTPRPPELVTVNKMMLDQASASKASSAAPQTFKMSQRYYQLAEAAYDDGEMDQAAHFAMLAQIKYLTAMEQSMRLAADERREKAERRFAAAEKAAGSYDARKEEADKRIARMEKLKALQKQLESERTRSAAEKKRIEEQMAKARAEAQAKLEAEKKAAAEKLAAEQALLEQTRKEKEVQELLADARSRIQMAEALGGAEHDSANLNSARTFTAQANKALEEKRFKNASDLAGMAKEKADAAIAKSKAAYAAKQEKMALLQQRKALFTEATTLGESEIGASVKQDRRGVVITLRDMFGSGKATVLPERTRLLDRIAELASKYADYPLVIEGYTDSRGRAADNLALSQSRAQSVLDYLVSVKKLTFERVKSAGYGASNPIADNSRAEGRAKNRRIEVIFLFR